MDRITYKDFGYAEVFVFKNFLITQIAEGIVVGEGHLRYLKMFIEKTYGSNPMVYLSNRINSYSVNPLVYHHFPEIPNLLGIGVVAYSPITIQNIKIEKNFQKFLFKHLIKLNKRLFGLIIWSQLTLKNT
ncbi:hypothetical protein [Nonlabens tegetincola]|uniref:hypothetical protein n=1 Tax=Nonlabens tegetincola TaxID=323273 RepID=UPI0011B06278|nr:hypothetical protein [Nonlabens tegetincola]